jgi:cobaltochelatase CobN
MHIANISSARLDDRIEPVDLAQSPADIAVLSFSDSDLNTIAAAHDRTANSLPSMRLAALRDLRHPMSVDLWIDSTGRHARVILVRLLGGYEWWRYGCEQLSKLAHETGIKLILVPGECRENDPDLARLSTASAAEQDAILACFREGGPSNIAIMLHQLAALAGAAITPEKAQIVPKMGFYQTAIDADAAAGGGTGGIVRHADIVVTRSPGRPVVPILFYRSILLANDQAPIDALVKALDKVGIVGLPLFVPTLKDAAAMAFVGDIAAEFHAAAIITTTAFAASLDTAAAPVFAKIGIPVLQAMIATTAASAWRDSERGLGVSDLAMHVVLPELDGRIAAGVLSFKGVDGVNSEMPAAEIAALSGVDAGPLQFATPRNQPDNSRIDQVVARLTAIIALQDTPPADRHLLIILPDYPGADGRTGYAVGLDVPQSVLAILADLATAGYTIGDYPNTARALLDLLHHPKPAIAAQKWATAFARLPNAVQQSVIAAWGPAPQSPIRFRHHQFGNVTVALAPDRGRAGDRRADYHDPSLPPQHELLAFGQWLREDLACHAVIHVGAHGTLEWLPGKAVALSAQCFPELVLGPVPVIYPFIVNNPGEAAQAKRRIAAQTIGHLPPPMLTAGLNPAEAELERLVDEFVQADGLDSRRRSRLAALIQTKAAETGLDRVAGVSAGDDADTALKQIDAWLCDLKDFAFKDGQHIFGRHLGDTDTGERAASADGERNGLLTALNGQFVAPGPAGSPLRGRLDVLPTGRNLFTLDPRALPTQTACDLGQQAADEVLRFYLQEHGQWPRALVIDLWGSASLRSAGEEIAQGLWLMGCRPQWQADSGRVSGIDVLPPALIGRPRVDVTWRISGLFRDMFAAQISLLSAATAAVAGRDQEGAENPLAEDALREGRIPRRIFGSSPGSFGSGAEDLLQSGQWQTQGEIGDAYLAASSHAFDDDTDGSGINLPGAFSARVAAADLLVHVGDDASRDILEGSADVAFIGGFAAAAARLGNNADVVTLDTSNPTRPQARGLMDSLRRVVQGRAVNPRYIAGQMRHGPRGAGDFAETVDRLVAFAETTSAVPDHLIGAVHDAYVAAPLVRDFILAENPEAARSIATRLSDARRRGLWHPLRNSIDDELADFRNQAQALVDAR